ncbi:hypothetical protein BH23ACT1_BH23ACT1_09930 [soil metagenome]
MCGAPEVAGREATDEATDEATESGTAEPGPAPSAGTRPPVWLIVLVVVVGVGIRAWILASPLGEVDSDEAVVGLMALGVLDGEIPTFFWDSNYGGTLDQLITAGVFAVVGASVLALKAVQVVLAGAACVLTWRVGRRIVGEGAARTAALLFWVAPAAYLLFSTKSRGWHWLGVCLTLGIVLMVLRLIERPRVGGAAVLGLLLGLSFWTSPALGFVALPAVVYGVARNPRVMRVGWAVVPAFLVGAAPWIRFNLVNDFASLEQPPQPVDSTYLSRLAGFFTDGLPMALGLKVPYSGEWLGGPVGVAVFVAALIGFGVLLVRCRRRLGLLLVLAGAYPLLFAVPASSFYVGEPRYVLFLAPVLALLVTHRLTTTAARGAVLAGAAVLSVISLASLMSWSADHPGNYDLASGDLDPVLSILERRGVNAAWGDYWTAYRITFETNEEVIAASVDRVRHPPYQAEVAQRSAPAFVVHEGTSVDDELGPALAADGIDFQRVPAGDFVVYLPDEAVDPVELEGVW